MQLGLIIALGAFLCSMVLTGWLRRYALSKSIIDVPNERSSHRTATALGGGVAIVLSTLAASLLLGFFHLLEWRVVGGMCAGGVVVGFVGYVDDRRHVAPLCRLGWHFVAAGFVLLGTGGIPELTVYGTIIDRGVMAYVIAALYLVWLINLTNFMDGIDGIASIEALTVCVGGALACVLVNQTQSAWFAPLVLAGAAAGFLVWNWPPARIFMGDSGSGFLGLMMGAFSLQAGWFAPVLFWAWAILLGVFVVDATLTLARRVVRRERFYEAHCSHAYQHAALKFGAHLPVTLTVAAINVCWLLPIALLVVNRSVAGATGVIIAYAPLVALAAFLEAGKPAAV